MARIGTCRKCHKELNKNNYKLVHHGLIIVCKNEKDCFVEWKKETKNDSIF